MDARELMRKSKKDAEERAKKQKELDKIIDDLLEEIPADRIEQEDEKDINDESDMEY